VGVPSGATIEVGVVSKLVLWQEVWIDNASEGEYLLVLRALGDGSFELLDPQQHRQIVATLASYEEAADWLNEDEYDLVEGRWPTDVAVERTAGDDGAAAAVAPAAQITGRRPWKPVQP
jgi:hypothetical protein